MSSDDEWDLDFISNASKKNHDQLQGAQDSTSEASDCDNSVLESTENCKTIETVEPEVIEIDDREPTNKRKLRSRKANQKRPPLPKTKIEKALLKLQKLKERNDDSKDDSIVHLSDSNGEDDEDSCGSIEIKIKWKHHLIRQTISKTDRLGIMFDSFCKSNGVSQESLSFYLGSKRIGRNDTAEALGIDIASFIRAESGLDGKNIEDEDQNEVKVSLKIRRQSEKAYTNIKIRKTDKMKVLFGMYSEIKNIPESEFRLVFDGLNLKPGDTPESLDMEDEDWIDAFLI